MSRLEGLRAALEAPARDRLDADPRYLACSPQTRSELVVLVEHRGRPVGEIDIDSDDLDPFSAGDLELLGEAASLLAPHLA